MTKEKSRLNSNLTIHLRGPQNCADLVIYSSILSPASSHIAMHFHATTRCNYNARQHLFSEPFKNRTFFEEISFSKVVEDPDETAAEMLSPYLCLAF